VGKWWRVLDVHSLGSIRFGRCRKTLNKLKKKGKYLAISDTAKVFKIPNFDLPFKIANPCQTYITALRAPRYKVSIISAELIKGYSFIRIHNCVGRHEATDQKKTLRVR
jgi:hypothetical protein